MRDHDLYSKKIGIIGCGHLGQALASALLRHGFDKSNLRVSFRGNPATYERLETQGLSACLVANDVLMAESDVIFIMIKPQDILQLKGAFSSSKAQIISCMAAISTDLLSKILGTKVLRMMLSGPDTVMSGRGVGTVYPGDEYLERLLAAIHVRLIKISSEKEMEVFTTGVCIPAALVQTGNSGEEQKAIERISTKYPLMSAFYEWAVKVAPQIENPSDKETYIAKMTTKAGITDAIIKSLRRGESLDVALQNGINRSEEISLEIQQALK